MIIVGSIDFFEGLIAVIRDQYYMLAPNQMIVFDLTRRPGRVRVAVRCPELDDEVETAGDDREPASPTASCRGADWLLRRGSWRSRSPTSKSAMSWLKPRLTTTRSTARSVRFFGNV
jgi:hypothetical protein